MRIKTREGGGHQIKIITWHELKKNLQKRKKVKIERKNQMESYHVFWKVSKIHFKGSNFLVHIHTVHKAFYWVRACVLAVAAVDAVSAAKDGSSGCSITFIQMLQREIAQVQAAITLNTQSFLH